MSRFRPQWTALAGTALIPAAVNGDSRSSIFAPRSDGKVNARGTVTGIATGTQVPCTGVPTGPTRICAWRMFYVDIFDALEPCQVRRS